MSDKRRVKFKSFPMDNRFYRIDFIGHVRKNYQTGQGLLVDVYMSPIKPGTSKSFKEIASQGNVLHEEQYPHPISVGELVAVEVGSVWKKRECIWRPSRKEEQVININVSSDSVQLINQNILAEKHGRTSNLFNKSHYKLDKAISSNFLAIRNNNDPYGILIPVMELIRFYYLGSSKYTKAIFSGLLNDMDNIVNEERIIWYPEDKMLFIKLRQNYKYTDGWLIARLLKSNTALVNARMIYNSIQRTFYNNKHYKYTSPQTDFPFIGNTKLRVLCKNVKFGYGDDAIWRKLILAIRNCSHSFPYEKLSMTRDNSGLTGLFDKDKDRDGKEEAFPNSPMILGTDDNGEDIVIDPLLEGDAGIQDEEISIALNRFSFLNEKRRVPFLKLFTKYRSASLVVLPPPEKETDYTTGPQSSGNDTGRPANISPDDNKPKPKNKNVINPSFYEFIEVIQCLQKAEEVYSSKFKTVNNDAGGLCNGKPVSYFPTQKKGKKREIKWAIVENGEDSRPRMAFFVEIKSRWGTAYVLEIEPKKTRSSLYVFANEVGSELGTFVLKSLLYRFATRENLKKIFEGLNMTRANHEASDKAAFAQRVLERIKDVCC